MTKEQLKKLEPWKTVVYNKITGDSIRYTFMGVSHDGTYQLCGIPFGYEESVVISCFEVFQDK